MLRRALAALFVLAASTTLPAQTPVVALDGFHNNESKMPDHYQWDGKSDGSFTKLGNAFRAHDVEIRTIRSRIDAKTLEGVRLLIIVDPDTPDETSDPKYIEDAE